MYNFIEDPYTMDWGAVSPEGYDSIQNQLLYVLNVDFSNTANRERIAAYVVGRISWYSIQGPAGASHRVIFDLRGQEPLCLDAAERLKPEMIKQLTEKMGLKVFIDIRTK